MPEFVVKGSKNDQNPGQSKKDVGVVSTAGDASTITSDYCIITQDPSMTLQYFNVPTTSYTTAKIVWDSWLSQTNKDTGVVVDYNHLPTNATWRGVQCVYTNAMFSNVVWNGPGPSTTPNTYATLWSAVPYDMVINGVLYNYIHTIYTSTYDGMVLMYKKHVDDSGSMPSIYNSDYFLMTVNSSLQNKFYNIPYKIIGADIVRGYSTSPPTVYPMIINSSYTVSGITGRLCGDYGCNVFNHTSTAVANNASTTTQYNAVVNYIDAPIIGGTSYNFIKYVWRSTSSGEFLYALYKVSAGGGGNKIFVDKS